jgi:rhodanese-related sulfurtransferase
MVKRVLLALTVFAVVTISIPWAAAQAPKPPERIAVTNLKQKIDSGDKFLLIDVREDWELEQNGAIAGAIHIPMAELDARMKDIPKDAEIVFY